jgi:hypothetical protein
MARDPREIRDQAADVGSTREERLVTARKQLPPNCPFVPVGFCDGVQYIVDVAGQLRGLTPRELTRNYILTLVGGDLPWLLQHFPRPKRTKSGVVDSFRPEAVADCIVKSCNVMGYWQPTQKVLGRGAWLGSDDQLVLHLGDTLWINGRLAAPGLRGEHVYQLGDRLPRPAREHQPEGREGPAFQLLQRLETFNWARQFDARFLFGWICCAMLGGALPFRPVVFVTGEPGVGKSTLHLLVKCVFGNVGVIATADTSPAGLWQSLAYDCIPVAVDELEASADNQRAMEIVKFARLATSGAAVIRGSANHQANEFLARSAFMFSAVVMPPFPPADASRVAVLELLKRQSVRPFDTKLLGEIGRQLLRRLADHFSRFMTVVLPMWRDRLAMAGWDARGCDLYGTLLAAADVALNDETPADEIDDLVATLEPIRQRHLADQQPEFRRCTDYLLALMIAPWRAGEWHGVGNIVVRASGFAEPKDALNGAGDPLMRSDAEAETRAMDDYATAAADALTKYGIKIVNTYRSEGSPQIRRWLAVANSHPALSRLFERSHWSAIPGSPGGWRNALLRTPDAELSGHVVRFGGVVSRAVMLPLESVLAGLVGPEQPAGPDETRERYRPDEAGEWIAKLN